MEKRLFIQLAAVFLAVQIIGLWAAFGFLDAGLQTGLYSEDINDPLNSVFLIAYIIVFTAILLAVLKLMKKKHSGIMLKGFEALAVFATGTLLFSLVVPEPAAIMAALGIIALRVFWAENIWFKNLASTVAAIGAGSIIGISIGVVPAAIFVLGLAAYDFIAVFKTRHMVTLAKAVVERNLAFTFSLPTKRHVFQLGTGDLVVPLVFASAALASSGAQGAMAFVPGAAVLGGSITGLFITLEYGSRHAGKPLPALPLQAVLMVLLFSASKLAGF